MATSYRLGQGLINQVIQDLETTPRGFSTQVVLEDNHAFLLEVIDNLPDYICIKDRDGRFIFNNRSHLMFLGAASREEITGKRDADFFPSDLSQQYSANDQTVFETGKPQPRIQELTRDRKGKPRWLTTDRIPLTDDCGTVQAVLCVSQDITERKQAEQSLQYIEAIYRTLIEGLPQRVFFKDQHSVFVSVNASFAGDFGLQPKDLIGKSDYDLFPQELADKYRADDQRIMELRQPEILEEANVSEGKRRIVEVVKVPVLDGAGNMLGLLGIFTDITERKNAETKLKTYAAKLQFSNRELQDFAYVASHDLQEPLRKVAVFGSRLQAKCGNVLDPEGQDYLNRMLKATVRMQTLINDLLSFARVTTQAKPFAPVNLEQVIQEVLTDLEARLEQVGGKVELASLPVLEADALQMRQLFQNLIGNALKFRRPNVPPVVKLKAELVPGEKKGAKRQDLSQEGYHITVEDNGIGFEEKYAERIFQVFQRLHNRAEYEGSGIGLAICRKIVERHGGTIIAKATPNQGATFSILLPATHNQEESVYEQK